MLADRIRDFLARHGLAPRRVAVAVSGGPDSVALLLALVELQVDVIAVHVHHHLRGDESDADERFVRELCERKGLELIVCDGTIDAARRRSVGVEAAAREIRYRLLRDAAAPKACDCIATGHHRDDQAETLLLRLITGSGLLRLRGIEPVSPDGIIVRPLLDTGRAEIRLWLAERGIEARHDSMNDDLAFLRNRVRGEVLPLLRELNPNIEETLAETARQAGELEAELRRFTQPFSDAVQRTETSSEWDPVSFAEFPWSEAHLFVRELRRLDPEARDVSAASVRRALGAAQSRTSVTRQVEFLRDERKSRLQLAQPATEPFECAISIGKSVEVAGMRVAVERTDEHDAVELSSTRHQLFELPPEIQGPLVVRSRREGDRIHPLGAPGSKSVSDLLTDRKIERSERDRLPLLVCGDAIVLIAGVTVAEPFKVTGRRPRYRATFDRT